jgi:N6-adenosine-specific RNA methylase IME4
MGRPPIKKGGAMTAAERQRKRRRKVARLKKLANPKLVAKQKRRAERERDLAAKIKALPTEKFGCILADPEWPWEVWSSATGMDRSPANDFPLSKLEDIKARDVQSIAADDCALWLWSTAPLRDQVYEVMRAWGFKPVTEFIWDKGEIGLGYWNRNMHEILLLGTKGNVPAPAPGRNGRPSSKLRRPDARTKSRKFSIG